MHLDRMQSGFVLYASSIVTGSPMLRLLVLTVSLTALFACGNSDGGFANLPTPTGTTPPDPSTQPTSPTAPAPTPSPTERPVAVCAVSDEVVIPFHEATAFDGSASYDPNDLEITAYDWELSAKPPGSAAQMPLGQDVRQGFVADQAGLYLGRLTVTNSAGVQSEACEVEVEAAPAESLWIEMFWDQFGDDMDLHLLAPGGTYQSESDCWYGNCKPTSASPAPLDWALVGYLDDNPVLDRDDHDLGPENINLLSPANGTYTIAVRDWGQHHDIVSTNVTVRVFIDGNLAWSGTRVFVGDPSEPVAFAEVEWPGGIVTSLLPTP